MKDKKLILSISFCFHDSCITLANEEEVLIHLEAERIFRAKHKKFNMKIVMIQKEKHMKKAIFLKYFSFGNLLII